MRAVTVIIGILLVITGIYCFINMKAAFTSLAIILGIIMAAYGISQIVTWFTNRKTAKESGWILAEGIFTAIIGVIVIFSPAATFLTEFVLAVIFAIWLIISGIMRIIGAVQIKKNFSGIPWGLMLFMGIITAIVGIYGFIHPVVAGMAIAVLLGIFFILQGVNCLIFGINLPGAKRK